MHKKDIIKISVAAFLFAVSFFTGGVSFDGFEYLSFFLCLASAAAVGYNVVFEAFEHLFKGRFTDENLLMTVASLGAFALGEHHEAAAIMLFFAIGEGLEHKAIDNSKKAVKEIIKLRPERARRLIDGKTEEITPSEIRVNDVLIIFAGEKVPTDCVITEGSSSLDVSALNGESLPREVSVGDEILSGSINKGGVLTVRAKTEFDKSTVQKIASLVLFASERKTKAESFITRFSRLYTPIVTLCAIFVFVIPSLITGEWALWLKRALCFLVASCPCALAVSVPLGFFSSLGAASKKGALIKGSVYIEALARARTVFFDKTGTLTEGAFSVTEAVPFENNSKERLCAVAAALEKSSSHPIARAISRLDSSLTASLIKETGAMGIEGEIEGVLFRAGKPDFVGEICRVPNIEAASSAVHIAARDNYLGYIAVEDKTKADAKDAVSYFKRRKIKALILTGDRKESASRVADEVGADGFYSSLMPADKLTILENAKSEGGTVFVGDGINDSPVLAAADVGVAMGAIGSAAAVEAADVVIMNDDLSLLPRLHSHAKRTMATVKANLIFALSVKLLVLILSVLGVGGMWIAVFADVGVTLIAVLNSLRLLKMK